MHFIPNCPFMPFDEVYSYESRHRYFMRCAYNEALRAWAMGEIPIGAVGVVGDEIVARSCNLVESKSDATAHAEIELIRKLSCQRCDWRLNDVVLYVTKEPCPMCSGAIYKSRIKQVFIGAYDAFQGCMGGCLHFNHTLRLYHKVEVFVESLSGACEELLTTFFRLKRCEKQ